MELAERKIKHTIFLIRELINYTPEKQITLKYKL